MSYQVISCRDCGTPRVVEAHRKTTQCPRCGKRLDLEKVIVHAETEDMAEARDAVGQINAQKAGGELLRQPDPRQVSPADEIDQAIGQARQVTGQAPRVKLAAQGLTEVLGRFTEDQWVEAMERLDVPEGRAIEHLHKLMRVNALAQPTPGRFQYVADPG